jgi:hypothetical protein
MLRNLNLSSSGRRICGIPQVGVLASAIPTTGFPLAPLLANDIDSAYPNRLYRVQALSQPSAGALYLYENSSFSFTGAPDGTYTGTQRVRKYDPGTGLVSNDTGVYSLTIGTVTADTAGPTMVGPITATATASSIAWAWPEATDPSGIGEYRAGLNGATPTSIGTARTLNSPSLPESTSYTLTVVGYDTLGNATSAPLTLTASTLAAVVTPPPDPEPETPLPDLPDATPPATAASRSYTWLKAAAAKWSHRTDLGPLLDDFIMLAEKRIDGDLKARLQNATAAISTIARLNAVLVPHDVEEIRSLSIAGCAPLEYMAPDQINDQFAASGLPRHYTVIGAYLYFAPTPDAVYSVVCTYRQQIPSLLDEADGENWLIRDHPEIYLAAVMCEVLGYTQNTTQVPYWEGKYRLSVDALNAQDWHTGGPMTVRTDVKH